MTRTWTLGRQYWTLLAVTLATPACMHALAEEEAAQAPPVAPTPSAAPAAAAKATSNPVELAWSVQAQAMAVPEFQGRPVVLPKGTRCKAFRGLPSQTFTTSTLIEDACLKIPSGATIEVRDGATLAIVATSELFIGKNVVFDAKGTRGRRGDRAEFAAVGYVAASDAEIRALCVEHGNRCPCPNERDALAPIRGQAGSGGSAGGSIHLVAGQLVSPSRLAGFSIDTSGGPGGPPGDSGSQQCLRGELRCSSEVCSRGVVAGATGPKGTVFFAMGGAVAAAVRERVTASLGALAPENGIALGPSTDVAARVSELDALAIEMGWARRSGDQLD